MSQRRHDAGCARDYDDEIKTTRRRGDRGEVHKRPHHHPFRAARLGAGLTITSPSERARAVFVGRRTALLPLDLFLRLRGRSHPDRAAPVRNA